MTDCCILINTCSLYFNLVEPHMILLRKYWTDCQFPVYINVDSQMPINNLDKIYNFEYIISDLLPKPYNILDRMLYALEFLKKKYKYVLYMTDDALLVRKMNNNDILESLKFIKSDNKIGTLKLHPSPTGKKFYKKMKFRGYFENIKEPFTDHICGHCLDLLYKKIYDLPHLEAKLWDDNIKFKHRNKTSIEWGVTGHLGTGVALWDLEFIVKGFNNLINSKNKKLLELKKKKEFVNDVLFLEVFGSKYNNKFKLFTDKVMLSPKNRFDIIYQNRGFCGGGIFRGWATRWVRELFKENNISMKYYNGYYIKTCDDFKETDLSTFKISLKDEVKICVGNLKKKVY